MKKLSFLAVLALVAGCADTEDTNTNEANNAEQTNTEEANTGEENTEQADEQAENAESNNNEEEEDLESRVVETTEEENPTGNHGGNIVQGGYMAMQGDTLYSVDYINGGYGIFQMSLEEDAEPEKILDVHASHLHPVEDGIFFIDNEEYVQPQGLHFYSFETEEVEVIHEGIVRNPQIADGTLWFSAMLAGEEDGPMSIHRYDFASGQIDDLDIYEVNFAVSEDHEIHQYEIFLHDAAEGSFEEEDALVDEATSPVFLDGDELYYNSFESAYIIDLETEETTEIIEEPTAFFNALNGHIFYSPLPEEDADGNLRYLAPEEDESEELGSYDSIYMFEGYSVARLDGQGVLTYDMLNHESGEWTTIYEDER